MAFYGTLRPGGEHHYEVRGIAGEWYESTVRGWVFDITWGPADGYPGITIDPNAPHTTVDVLESDDLEHHLRRIDEFEGPGYRRIETTITLADGTDSTAWIYDADPEA